MYNIFSFLQDSTKLYPDKIYVIDKDREFSYSDIYGKSVAVAGFLNKWDIRSGDRVLVYLDNSIEYIAAYFGILLANCIVVPINKNLTLDSVNYIISNTEPKLIFTNSIFRNRLQGKVGFESHRIVDINNLFGSPPTNHFALTSQLIVDDDLPAIILYTSGTTRMPKGVALSHKNLTANTASILQYLKLTAKDSLLGIVNFGYSYGNSLLLTHTKVGGKIIIENRVAYPMKVIEQIYASEATGFSTVGSYINVLLKQTILEPHHLQHLHYITFAGESTNFEDIVKIYRIAPHLKIFVMYGQTEASARLSYLEPDMLPTKRGSVGKGIPGVILKVVNELGEEVAPGEIGEIIAFGENIMLGYWNNETESQSVIQDGWLHTGDMAVRDEDGYIYIKGRNDDMIKHLGIRLSPVEIEFAINSCELVFESAVIGISHEEGNQIKAFVVLKNEMDHDRAVLEIHSYIKKLLPAFKVPKIIEIVRELPRTTTGKIRRSELRNKK